MRFDDFEYNLRQAINEVNGDLRRHRLIIITNPKPPAEELAQNPGVIPLNLNLRLSEKLLNIPQSKRSRAISAAVEGIVSEYPNEQVLLLNHFELLFLPELQQDPIRLFEYLSRERTIVLLWPGDYSGGLLSYAQPWHSEYHEFRGVDAKII